MTVLKSLNDQRIFPLHTKINSMTCVDVNYNLQTLYIRCRNVNSTNRTAKGKYRCSS